MLPPAKQPLAVTERRLGGNQTLYGLFREKKNTMTLTVTGKHPAAASP